LKELSDIAAQVAHDIRSPIGALVSIEKNQSQSLPVTTRRLLQASIRRIREISEDLIVKYQTPYDPKSNQSDRTNTSQLFSLLTATYEVFSEKNTNNTEVHLDFSFDSNVCTVALEGNKSFFQRALSNLINNAFDATNDLPQERKKVFVRLDLIDKTQCTLSIHDNGRGMPKKILRRLGLEQITYGKESLENSGMGLGAKQAHQAIEAMKGQIEFQSELNKYTEVKITLPIAKSKFPYSTAIKTHAKIKTIYCADDELEIHRSMRSRIENIYKDSLNANELVLDHSFTAQQIKIKAMSEESKANAFYLIDNNFRSCPERGIDVIRNAKISKQALLVTDQFDDPSLIAEALKNDIFILPKPLIEHLSC
ncbi:sensor histidine kinase, partial [bacterium]|nr:sensor histidine kinase [bacterium]